MDLVVLSKARRVHHYQGLKVGRHERLSHLLFVDDILIFFLCVESDGKVLKDILELFCNATNMVINITKSIIFFSSIEEGHRHSIANLFNFPSHDLEDDLKNLGYVSKPNSYGITYWNRKLTKIEKRINLWCNKWVYRAGHLVLVESVIEAIPVYWHILSKIPKGILNWIQKLYFN